MAVDTVDFPDDAADDVVDPWIRLEDLVGEASYLAGDLVAASAADSSVDLVVDLPAFCFERDKHMELHYC